MIGGRRTVNEGGESGFVVRCLRTVSPNPGFPALDIPCGRGRHSRLLSGMGYRVVCADIDPECLDAVRPLSAVRLDARVGLPFAPCTFGLVMVVDFVAGPSISEIFALTAPGGFVIYETFGLRGRNWIELHRPGEMREMLERNFDILEYRETPSRNPEIESVSVKALARRMRRQR